MTLLQILLGSSIGRKAVVAASGAVLALFLALHLAGSLVTFLGAATFNAYHAGLHSLGPLLALLELALAGALVAHAVFAAWLWVDSLAARPCRYAVPAALRGRLSSGTMPFTGLLILVFLVVHLADFRFAASPSPLAAQVVAALQVPPRAAFYLLAVAALTVHVSHGFWSLFQTLGLSHPGYSALIRQASLAGALGTGGLFMLIPILILASRSFLR
ncbi:MAG: succinate dehydrogenase [Thermodesulfobacteriota bacterium]